MMLFFYHCLFGKFNIVKVITKKFFKKSPIVLLWISSSLNLNPKLTSINQSETMQTRRVFAQSAGAVEYTDSPPTSVLIWH